MEIKNLVFVVITENAPQRQKLFQKVLASPREDLNKSTELGDLADDSSLQRVFGTAFAAWMTQAFKGIGPTSRVSLSHLNGLMLVRKLV